MKKGYFPRLYQHLPQRIAMERYIVKLNEINAHKKLSFYTRVYMFWWLKKSRIAMVFFFGLCMYKNWPMRIKNWAVKKYEKLNRKY